MRGQEKDLDVFMKGLAQANNARLVAITIPGLTMNVFTEALGQALRPEA